MEARAGLESGTGTYEWWAETILESFLPPIGRDQTATLSVARESLIAATGDADAPARLGRAVASRLDHFGRFSLIHANVRDWERVGSAGPHPALPLLALTVLAAADMGEARDLHGNDFYRPLRRLLDPLDEQGGAPRDFTDVIDQLWNSLDRWLDDCLEGKRGRSSFKPPPHPRHVGYSVAQAIVRGTDRRLLRRFLAMALGEDDEEQRFTVEELRAPLLEWARRLGRRGRRLARLAESPRLEGICSSVLSQELDQVRAQIASPSSVGQICLLVDLSPLSLRLVAERLPGFPATLVLAQPGGQRSEVRSATERWYEPLPLEVSEVLEALASGMMAGEPPCVVELDPAPVVALSYDDTWGAWRSVRRLHYGDVHHLLVAVEQVGEVMAFLHGEGLDPQLRSELSPALGGWELIAGVRLDRRPLAEAPPDLAALLGAGGGPTARLVGGLRVPPLRRRYLTGGEPLLRLPWAMAPKWDVELEYEGQWTHLQPIDVGGPQAEVPLRGRQLKAGHYTVRVGGRSLPFELVDAVVSDLPAGIGNVTMPIGNSRVCGYLPVDDDWPCPSPVTFPARPDAGVLVLGASDDEFAIAREPTWMAQLAGGLSWTVREIDAPFRVAWAVLERDGEVPLAFPMAALEPIATGEPITRWLSTIRAARASETCELEDQQRLRRYQRFPRRSSW